MKYLLLVSFVLVAASCSSSKKVLSEKEALKATSVDTVKDEKEQLSKVNSDANTITHTQVKNKMSSQDSASIATVETLKKSVQAIQSMLTKMEQRIDEKTKSKLKDSVISKISVFDHTLWQELLQKHVSDKGNVNYKGFKSDRKLLNTYIDNLSKQTPQDSWSKQEKLSYWINAYNALTVDLILRFYPVKSIKDIKDPWDQRFWKLGAKWYNLNDIEHKILRKMDEPRIHFAIVCASFSCPKLQNIAFIPEKLDDQLTLATKSFLRDPLRNNIGANTLELSKIFKWFSKDFKVNDGTLIDFLNTYSDIKISPKAKQRFKVYNWSLNE